MYKNVKQMLIYVLRTLSTDNLHQTDWNFIKNAFFITLLVVKLLLNQWLNSFLSESVFL